MASAMPEVDRSVARSTGRSNVKSCLRALDVIYFFTQTDAPARTIDISEALGIPNSSADEILRTLASKGYLTYNRTTKRYAPSYKLVATSRGIERNFFGGDYVDDLLRDIRVETGATVYLTLQNDCWVESVAELHGCWCEEGKTEYPSEIILYEKDRWRPGTNFAAAMLAQQSNVEIIDLVTRAQKLGLGPKGPSLMKYLVDRVARTRAQGFALCRRGAHAPVDSIAIPLQLPHSVTPYAVGVVGEALFESDGDVKRMTSAMQAAIIRQRDRLQRHVKPRGANNFR